MHLRELDVMNWLPILRDSNGIRGKQFEAVLGAIMISEPYKAIMMQTGEVLKSIRTKPNYPQRSSDLNVLNFIYLIQ